MFSRVVADSRGCELHCSRAINGAFPPGPLPQCIKEHLTPRPTSIMQNYREKGVSLRGMLMIISQIKLIKQRISPDAFDLHTFTT